MEQQQEKQSIFRKKAMDRISSPEQLDQCLTVTGPGVWLSLITVVILLVGAFFWMIFGHLDVNLDVAVSATDKGVICYVPEKQKDSALGQGTIRIADQDLPLSDVGLAPVLIDGSFSNSFLNAGKLKTGDVVIPLKVEADLMEGLYSGQIMVESVNPITFIIN